MVDIENLLKQIEGKTLDEINGMELDFGDTYPVCNDAGICYALVAADSIPADHVIDGTDMYVRYPTQAEIELAKSFLREWEDDYTPYLDDAVRQLYARKNKNI